MIRHEVPCHASDLFALLERSSHDSRAVCRPFLADFLVAPDDLCIRLSNSVFLLDLAHAALFTVIRKLRSMRPDVHRDELIPGIPLKRPATVGCETAIRVVGECLAGTCGIDLVDIAGLIAAAVRSEHG